MHPSHRRPYPYFCPGLLAALLLLLAAMPALAQSASEVVTVRHEWSAQRVSPGQTTILAVVIDMQDKWHVNPSRAQLAAIEDNPFDFLIPTELSVGDWPKGLTSGGAVQYPQPHAMTVNFTGEPVELMVYEKQAVLYLPVKVADDAPLGEVTFRGTLNYQTCDDKVCLPPASKTLDLTLTINPQAATQQAEPSAMFDGYDPDYQPPQADTGGASGDSAAGDADGAAGTWGTFLGVLLLAFVGGAVLNVMPCVLPVIPIKIMGLVHSAASPRRRVFLGAVMALGVLSFWVVIGLAIALLAGATGISKLFSFWWFNMAIGGLIVFLAVSMCGVFNVQLLPRWVYQFSPSHDSVSGSFGFGVMTAVLATPCTGPFMGGSAGVVLSSGPWVALAVFAAIGLGMAIPYLLLTMFPGLVEKLPRTGPASEVVKQTLGLLMLAAGAFFLGTGVNALLSDGTAGVYQWYWWLAGALAALAGLWVLIRSLQIARTTRNRVGFAALGLVMMAASLGFAYDATRPSDIPWVYYTPERFEETLAGGNVVMMDFTADWCINCKVLERSVLETQPVINAVAASDVVPMKVDLTGDNPAGWQLLNDADRVAIPLLVVYRPDGSIQFISEFYNAQQVVSAIEAARR